jgi:diguanylate cyclase (GGDEF)-like protein/PAS domain S-box-containing protein
MESYAEADSLRLRYADIYDFSPVAYISIDAVGAIRQINLAGAILLGIKGSDAMRHRFGASVAAADLPRFDRFLHDVLAGRTRKTLELTLTPTGQRGPAVVQITAIPDEGGHECRMVVSDITERHQAVEELAASEARYRQLIDSLPISLVIAQDGLICLANSRALELFGYGPQEAIGRSFLSMIVAEDQAKVMDAHQRRMAGDDAPLSYEVRLLHRDGTRIDCRIYARTIDWQGRRASLGIFDDITERKRMEQELRNLATTDVLTGLPNRRQFITRLEEELARVQRNPGHDAMVLMLDLDHFKLINDSLGHAAGDQVLREFSAILLNELRKVDSAGRIGGEEFAVLLPDTDMEAARIFADRLRHKVEAEAHAGLYPTCPTHPITVSIGIAAMKSADTSVDASLVRADEALYRAKEAGRNRTDVSR